MTALQDHAHRSWLMHVTVQVLKELENLSAEAMIAQQHSVYGTEWLMLQLAFAGSLLMDLLQMRWQSNAPAGELIFLAVFTATRLNKLSGLGSFCCQCQAT